MLKTRQNHKKVNSPRDFLSLYDTRQSNTISTNESKINHSNNEQTLAKFQSSFSINYSTIISKNTHKYGASNNLFYLNDFEQKFSEKRTKNKILMNDIIYNKEQQFIQQYYKPKQIEPTLEELLEYYKYYMNYPMMFQKQHFKILYNFYQKKKYLQYKKLKNLLNLSDDQQSQVNNSSQTNNQTSNNNNKNNKKDKKLPSQTFFIMNIIKTSFNKDIQKQQHSESNAFISLYNQLQTLVKKNSIYTKNNIQQRNQLIPRFPFKKKIMENQSRIQQFNKKYKQININNKYKSKKQSTNNSYSSKKNTKLTKYQKQISPYTIIQNNIHKKINQSTKLAQKYKNRHQSNFIITQTQNSQNNNQNINNYNQNINNRSTKIKFIKKRLNSCQDIITRLPSKQRIIDRKINKLRSCDQVKKGHKLQNKTQSSATFQSYLNNLNKIKSFSKNNKKIQQTLTTYNSQMLNHDDDPASKVMKIKKMKKKLKSASQSSTASLQKYQQDQNKNKKCVNQIQQNISILKLKIKQQKQVIKSTLFNNSSSQFYSKKQRIK